MNSHDSAIPVSEPTRSHVLQIVGNAIVGGMENYVARLYARPAYIRAAALDDAAMPKQEQPA